MPTLPIVTRIAPSPTGFLHIGTARTALFNWLFARHHGGAFHLRIEDTDRERSTEEATQSILRSLQWLGLEWDGEPVYQFARAARHREVAEELLARGQAYRCYTPPEELQRLREAAQAEGKMFKFQSPWRDKSAADAPGGAKSVIRLKAPLSGPITVQDQVQGEITVDAKELDDMVLLRSDGTPTYMLAVVVDDHDMHITHVIRGHDHLTNTFRQVLIYNALGWRIPTFAHIPLIHGADGAKLSKRHGALGVEAYRDMGLLPEAVRNYLLRLGWSHGNDEIISTAQAIEWFGLEGVGKSPARFDMAKLENLNAHYMREAEDARLVELILPQLIPPACGGTKGGNTGATNDAAAVFSPKSPRRRGDFEFPDAKKPILLKAMPGLKSRAKNLNELAENAKFYVSDGAPEPDEKAREALEKGRDILTALVPLLEAAPEWNQAALETTARAYAEQSGQKLGNVAQPLRAALTGRTVSPSVFEAMEVLGREESLKRLER